MKRKLLVMLALMLPAAFCFAQAGKVQIGIGAETNLFLSNGYSNIYSAGFGGNIKGLYGIDDASQITLTGGYTYFSGKSSSQYGNQNLSLLPILAGYRYNLKSGLYAEGQLGVGSLTTHVTGGNFTQTNFAAALNVGYCYKGLDLSIRYYTEGDVISIFAVRVGYNFSLGGGK